MMPVGSWVRRIALDVWPPFLNLRMAWNTGVNFGLFASDSDIGRWVLIGLALIESLCIYAFVVALILQGKV